MKSHLMEFVNGWFLMDSPRYIAVILTSYLLIVLKLGPDFMKNRDPYRLNNVIVVYNTAQVILSCFLVYLFALMVANHGLIPRTCMMDTEDSKSDIAIGMYVYLCAKIFELMDTIFFVLRKKFNQVSFLHVYHHTLMVIITWTTLKYEPTYILLFLGLLNSCVHVVMYLYYGLSAVPWLVKYLWWKKYLTIMQLIQFVAVFIHFGFVCVLSNCTPSKILSTTMLINLFLFLYLFGKFYINTYNKADKKIPNDLIPCTSNHSNSNLMITNNDCNHRKNV